MNLWSGLGRLALWASSRFAVLRRSLPFAGILGAIDRQPRSRPADLYSFLAAVKQNEWIAVSIMRIADAIMFARWSIVDEQDKEIEDLKSPVVQIFANPNPIMLWPDFIEQMLYYWLATGNAFILKARPAVAGNPTELWLLRPDRVRIIPHPTEFIAGYEYMVTGSASGKIKFKPEEIVHIKFAHPTDPYWGMGRIEASERLYASDTAAAEWAHKYFANGADPGSVLSTEGQLSDETWRHLREQWREQHEGFKNAHKVAVLEQGLKHERSGSGPKEADFIQTRSHWREGILALFGVQPLKAGITEGSNRATAFVQERSWQRDTIMPLLRRLEPRLSQIAALFGPYAFKFEDLVAEDNVEDATIAGQYLNAGAITPNEIRRIYMRMPEIKAPGMDSTYLPMGLFPVGEEPPAPEAPAAPAAKPEDQKQEEPAAPAGAAARAPRGTSLQRRIYRTIVQQRLAVQRDMKREVARYFRGQGDRVIERFLRGQRTADQALEWASEDQSWSRLWTRLQPGPLKEQYKLTMTALGGEPMDFAPGNPQFDRRLKRLARGVRDVSAETRRRLDDVIREGEALGLSPTQIANGDQDAGYDGIRGAFDEFSQARSQLIARTESARLLDQANTAAYKDMGVASCDVIGCEDEIIVEGQEYGCNSQNVPTEDAAGIEFHPNHKGAIVPRFRAGRDLPSLRLTAGASS